MNTIRTTAGAALIGLSLLAAPAQAALIQLTYSIDASDFRNSNDQSPGAPTSNAVSGILSFVFDDSNMFGEQDNIVPVQASGFDITKNNGVLIDYDETNSAVDFTRNSGGLGSGRVMYGATFNSNDFMVGLSDDFRIEFAIDSNTYQFTSLLEGYSFVSTHDAFFVAQNNTISLLAVSPVVVPLPASLWLLLSGITVLGVFMRKRH